MYSLFLSSYKTLVKVWENSKKLWKHSPEARVPAAFLVLPNFHSCFYNSIKTWYVFYFLNKKGFSLLYKANRSHVAVRLFSDRSQKTSKCGTRGVLLFTTLYFDLICDLLLNRRTVTWNLFVIQQHRTSTTCGLNDGASKEN